jgi:hypothetical protein
LFRDVNVTAKKLPTSILILLRPLPAAGLSWASLIGCGVRRFDESRRGSGSGRGEKIRGPDVTDAPFAEEQA